MHLLRNMILMETPGQDVLLLPGGRWVWGQPDPATETKDFS